MRGAGPILTWSVASKDAGQAMQDAIQEQLGLKPETKKMPIDMPIVDRADQAPTEN